MTPGARLAAALELLEAVSAAEPPIEPIVERFVRARRYMGSKDRRAVTERLYAVIRAERRLDWRLAQAGAEPTPRLRLIAHLLLADGLPPRDLASLFSGDGHAAAPLDPAEAALAEPLAGRPLDDAAMPAPVAGEFPDWLEPALTRAFGDALAAEMAALNGPAPLDLRVNTLKGSREQVREALTAEEVESDPAPLSPTGLRARGRASLPATRAFRDGLIEVQDEGSQLVALLAGARPGLTVVDFCAGAGGKTLALAAAMGREGAVKGTLWALDVEARFLERLTDRAKRAGAGRIRTHVLAGDDEDAAWLAARAGTADVVLVDAPCSGSGTWRRHPAAKRWLTTERLADLMARQGQALVAAADLVRPGGRLVYATCSILTEENEDQVAAFLAARPDFAAVPVAEAWAEVLDAPCPAPGPFLSLTPASTGTDGFFAAVLTRRA